MWLGLMTIPRGRFILLQKWNPMNCIFLICLAMWRSGAKTTLAFIIMMLFLNQIQLVLKMAILA